MSALLRQLWQNVRTMPPGLRLLTFGLGVIGTLLLVSAFGTWRTIDGTPISSREFWLGGAGLSLIGVGVTMILAAALVCGKWRWARIILLIAFIAYWVTEFDPRHGNWNLLLLAFASAMIAGFWHYLYFQAEVVAYFRPKVDAEQKPGVGEARDESPPASGN